MGSDDRIFFPYGFLVAVTVIGSICSFDFHGISRGIWENIDLFKTSSFTHVKIASGGFKRRPWLLHSLATLLDIFPNHKGAWGRLISMIREKILTLQFLAMTDPSWYAIYVDPHLPSTKTPNIPKFVSIYTIHTDPMGLL